MTELVTLLGDAMTGTVKRDRNGRLSFVYEDDWRRQSNAYPLSLSMPLAATTHGRAAVDPFLWGLLPDNERVLEQWGKRFHVSARNAFSLLAYVGEDCAGAVRFARPERLGEMVREGDGDVQWLTEKDVGDRLRALRRDSSAWRSPNDTGQFSLAGAQPKTALLLDGNRWGVPFGRIPTTHILKPGAPGLDGHAENEHFCLALAAELGLPVASSQVERFDGEVAIVIERYDRVRTDGRIVRVHQEDVCQALGVHPEEKYENDGGPGATAIVRLLRENSREPVEDVETFVQALAYNWIVAGTDGHAKNYSLLIGEAGRVRLAPLYDIASILPYSDPELRKLKLAMKIGGKYRIREIGARQWRNLASELVIHGDELIETVSKLAEQVSDLSTSVLKNLHERGLDHAALNRLADGVSVRARECVAALRVRVGPEQEAQPPPTPPMPRTDEEAALPRLIFEVEQLAAEATEANRVGHRLVFDMATMDRCLERVPSVYEDNVAKSYLEQIHHWMRRREDPQAARNTLSGARRLADFLKRRQSALAAARKS